MALLIPDIIIVSYIAHPTPEFEIFIKFIIYFNLSKVIFKSRDVISVSEMLGNRKGEFFCGF